MTATLNETAAADKPTAATTAPAAVANAQATLTTPAVAAVPCPSPADDPPVSISSASLLLLLVGGAHVGLAHCVGLKIPDPYPAVFAFGGFTFGLVVVKGFLLELACRRHLGLTESRTLAVRQVADNIHVGWSLIGLIVILACIGERGLTDPEIGLGACVVGWLAFISFYKCNSIYWDASSALTRRMHRCVKAQASAASHEAPVSTGPTPTAARVESSESFEKA